MLELGPFSLPKVTDEDIRWVSAILGLPESAFRGEDGTDPRQSVLKSSEQIDVAACPGSGKTTLLVAKLAILSKKWRYRTRGMCVLSHTNAARHEIETGLGNTTAGRSLLSYPHFIGTIHSFVNEFLAIPWLRAQGYPIVMIDTDTCERRRWHRIDRKWRSTLERKYIGRSDIRIIDTRFNWAKKNSPCPVKESTDTHRHVRDACQETAKEGYHCHDDMFVWAHDLINTAPEIVKVIRDRFPLLFIDEAQDNSHAQSAILYRTFLEGGTPVIRQRLGDGDQAIFDFSGAKEAAADKFPDNAVKRELPSSHRFGQKIADLADPLGIDPYGLVGKGPKNPREPDSREGQHTIFLFDDTTAAKVLNAYGDLLIGTFSEKVLREGTFTAVGQVHKPPREKGDIKFPHHLGHYWPDYDPELASRDATPQFFVQYALEGGERAASIGETHPAVERIAQGVLRLAAMAKGGAFIRRQSHLHLQVVSLLRECVHARDRYEELIAAWAVRRETPTKETWQDHWCNVVRTIAEAITKTPLSGPEVEEFMRWKDPAEDRPGPQRGSRRWDNTFYHPNQDPKVRIRLGSIHSVKGKTHTATLVCETFWKKYNLESLRPWIIGERKGWKPTDRSEQQYRLKVHYVAVTRPTHLLCLAMKRTTFEVEPGKLDENAVSALRRRGWQVTLVQ